MQERYFIDRQMSEEEKVLYKLAQQYLNVAEDLFGPQIEGVNFTGVYVAEKPSNNLFRKWFFYLYNTFPKI